MVVRRRRWRKKAIILASLMLPILVLAAYLRPAAIGLDVHALKHRLFTENRELYRAVKRTIQQNDIDIISAADPDTPQLGLILSRNDIAHFTDLYARFEQEDRAAGLQYYSENNNWRNAKLSYGGKTYRVKAKAHGKNPSGHRVGKFMSYAVKLRDGEQLFGFRRFSLIVGNRIQSDRHVVKHLAKRFGLLYHDLQLVRLHINSWDEKFYYLQPTFNDDFFEALDLSSLRTFKRDVSPSQSSHKSMLNISGDAELFTPHRYRADFRTILTDAEYADSVAEELIARHEQLNHVIASGDYERILDYFDLEYISSFDAFRTMIAASPHGFNIEENFHVAYDLANGFFYPVVTDDIVWERLHLPPGQAVEERLDRYSERGETKQLRLFNLFSQNDRIRQRKYEKIAKAIYEDHEELLRSHATIMAKFDALHYLGVLNQILAPFGMSPFPVHTENNNALLRDYLERAAPEARVESLRDGLRLTISPHSMAGLRVASLHLDPPPGTRVSATIFVEEEGTDQPRLLRSVPFTHCEEGDCSALLGGLLLADGIDGSSRRMPRRYTAELRLADAAQGAPPPAARLRLENALTGKAVETELSSELRDEPLPVRPLQPDRGDARAAALRRYADILDFELREAELVVEPGTYDIDEDIVLPPGLKLVLSAGTTLRLGPEVLLMSRNGLEVRGTEQEPVRIVARSPDAPFGAVGVVGTPETTTEIRHLYLRGGRERTAHGIYFSGALSIYHHKAVTISDSTIAGAQADDGLNIKYAPRVVIRNTRFEDNTADHVDLDYCDALVVGCEFSNSGDANGDGLDLSGSNVVVYRNTFENLRDKGVSIGERSRAYVLFNQLSGNNLGVAVKDSSVAYLCGNDYRGNAVDVTLYRKKNIWGGATAYLLSSAGPSADLVYQTDELSTIVHREVDEDAIDAWRAQLDDERLDGFVDLGIALPAEAPAGLPQ